MFYFEIFNVYFLLRSMFFLFFLGIGGNWFLLWFLVGLVYLLNIEFFRFLVGFNIEIIWFKERLSKEKGTGEGG